MSLQQKHAALSRQPLPARSLRSHHLLDIHAALATEDPRPELLLMKPAGRTESLISKKMWKHILVQGVYQMFWLFLILCAACPTSLNCVRYLLCRV